MGLTPETKPNMAITRSGIGNLISLTQRLTITYELLNNQKNGIFINQVRCMSRYKRRFTTPPFWQAQKTRTHYPENVTSENESFVSEFISDKYKSPVSPLRSEPLERCQWTPKSKRCGTIARKIGIYPMWKKDGTKIFTTLLQVSDNHVIKYVPPEECQKRNIFHKSFQRYRKGMLIVGADQADPREFTKEYWSLFAEAGVLPKKRMTKFKVSSDAVLAPGTPLYASHFRPGDYVDISGKTIDRGYQGVMQRWGFKGGPASHGNTKNHRRPGNTGGGGEKARIWPGKKLPGHMGNEFRTLRGLKIWRVNTKYNVIWVSGLNVPGSTGSYVTIYDCALPTRKFSEDNHPHFPTFFQDEQEDLPEELYDDSLHAFSTPSITFADAK